MRILQTMAGARHGGAEAFFERLAPALSRAGETQGLVIRADPERGGRLRAKGCEVLELPFGGWFDFRTKAGLRGAIADFKPDIVLSWMNRATKFCPRGDFVHAARLGGYYNLKYYRDCDHLIANTRGIADYLRAQGWPKDQVHYLPNFVAVEKAQPVARPDIGVFDDAPLALALGRLHRNKGFDVLLEALAQLPHFHLALAGEGPEQSALMAQATELGIANRVHFLGWRGDVAALLAAADMFVCPSRLEPLGNVVIEAWAAGVPVVAAASAGPVELIHDGENGILVPIEDAQALADGMQKLATSAGTRAHLVSVGGEAYEREFSEARVVGLYQEFFIEVKR